MHQNEMTETDYEKFAMEKLDEWIHDLLENNENITSQNIYDKILESIQDSIDYHRKQLDKASDLLSLVKGHRPIDFSAIQWYGSTDNQNKWTLPVESDPVTGECFLSLPQDMLSKLSWKEGDQLEWVNLNNGSFELRKV